MARLGDFLIGFLAGALLMIGWNVGAPRKAPPDVRFITVRDTVRTACCDEFLEHINREHGWRAR